ncbi:hypothetical protein ADUPG1_008195, partial [Aduncisulcus paluster]
IERKTREKARLQRRQIEKQRKVVRRVEQEKQKRKIGAGRDVNAIAVSEGALVLGDEWRRAGENVFVRYCHNINEDKKPRKKAKKIEDGDVVTVLVSETESSGHQKTRTERVFAGVSGDDLDITITGGHVGDNYEVMKIDGDDVKSMNVTISAIE